MGITRANRSEIYGNASRLQPVCIAHSRFAFLIGLIITIDHCSRMTDKFHMLKLIVISFLTYKYFVAG